MNSSKVKEAIGKYVKHQNVLFSILYRENMHTESLVKKIWDLELEVLNIKTIYDLGDWIQELEEATKKYSKLNMKKLKNTYKMKIDNKIQTFY